jgi:hypothetical protein
VGNLPEERWPRGFHYEKDAMKTFRCDACDHTVFFDNVSCVRCGHALGFLPDVVDLSALERDAEGELRALAPAAHHRVYRDCANGTKHGVCNWMIPVEDPNPFCAACRLNDVIPDLAIPGNFQRWRRIEAAKRRLLYTVRQLGLPTDGVPEEGRPSLRFRFLGDAPGQPVILTNHENGVVTLNIAEADDDVREQRRVQFNEPLRTLLGHFRHEAAHYYWFRLVADSPWLARFRELFGDETTDYQAAIERYHLEGPPADWNARGVSAYASAHPWEDWAETTAHYFHMVDAVETAAESGICFRPTRSSNPLIVADAQAAACQDCDWLLRTWIPLAAVLNSFNRGMGLPDIYPFVLSDAAIEKLRFVHAVMRQPAPNVAHADQEASARGEAA